MKLGTFLAVAAVCGLSGGMAAAQTPPSSGTPSITVKGESARLPRNWVKAESQHFIVYSDARRADIDGLMGKLERFHYVLRAFLKMPDEASPPEAKTELYYLAHEQDIDIADPAGPDYAIGLYKSCEDGVQSWGVDMHYDPDPKAPLEKQPENEGLSYIFQAYARHFLYQHSYQRTPTWYIDGFAQYFSTARFDGNEAIIGMAPKAYGTYLQMIGGDLRYSLDYKDILLQNDSDGHNYIGQPGVHAEFEARSWILTHYILSSHANIVKFQSYLARVAKGEAPVAAFQQAFTMSIGQLNAALGVYRRTGLQAAKLNFKALPEAQTDIETLPPAANRILLWDSALKACPGAKYGPALLQSVQAEAAKFPGSDMAQMALSRGQVDWGDPNAALPYLKGFAGSTSNFDGLYLLGRAQFAVAQKGDPAAYALASDAFRKASAIDPQSPRAAWFYYRSEMMSHDAPDDEATAAALLAWQLAPEVDAYALQAGLVYAHLGRKTEALQALHTVADNPRGRSVLVATAKSWIDKISTGASDTDILAAMKTAPSPASGLDEWTTASADVVKAVIDAANSEDAQAALSSADPQDPQAVAGSVFGR